MEAAARLGGQGAGETRSIRKVVAASFIGTTIEWYDFFLYGTAAALVFNELFFPDAEPLIGTLAAFGTYAVGFAARPIGGIVFGHYGDRIVATWFAHETYRTEVTEDEPRERELVRERRFDRERIGVPTGTR
jgi:MFS family permease